MTAIDLVNVKKFYKDMPHQKVAVGWLGNLLLSTPAQERLDLDDPLDILYLSDEQLKWLQKQISEPTLNRFAELWRIDLKRNSTSVSNSDGDGLDEKLFSQRDNETLPHTTCSSSAHAMYVDYQLRVLGKSGLTNDNEYLRRVFSGKYGKYGKNPSVSWDIQTNVCRSYGIKSKYVWNGDFDGLKRTVEQEGCSVINIFHRGTRRSNRSGGHVVLATDFDDQEITIHDPYGTRPPNYNLTQVGKLYGAAKNLNVDSEYDILRRLVLCEARGEGVVGMALVARVVLNRVNLTKERLENFNTREGSIKGIVYAPYQFEPTWSKNNNMKTIYRRVDSQTVEDADKAIKLAQNSTKLKDVLVNAGVSNSDSVMRFLRSTFFAAQTHPQAITPYLAHHPIAYRNQIFGEGKNTTKVDFQILWKPFSFDDGKKALANQSIVGVYKMNLKDEFSWRWQGCYRFLDY